jgi:hypothetical protein
MLPSKRPSVPEDAHRQAGGPSDLGTELDDVDLVDE